VGPQTIDQSFFKETKRSQRGQVVNYTYTVDENDVVYDDIYEFFNHIHDPLVKLLKENISFWRGIQIVYKQLTELEDLKTGEKDYRYLGTNSIAIRHENFIESIVHYIQSFLLTQLEIYNANGSGHRITGIENAIVTVGEYRPVRVRGYIPTPTALKRRYGLLNIKGKDGLCFKYCIAARFFMHEVEKINTRFRKYDKLPVKGMAHRNAIRRALENGRNYVDYFDRFDWEGINFPITLAEIDVFEENNNIAVNVFKNIGPDIVWIRKTTLGSEKLVELLLVEDSKTGKSHFILIHDRSKFEGKDGVRKHIFCTYCQKRFHGENALNKHQKQCYNMDHGIMEFPEEDSYKFTKYEMTMKFPFCLYYDWECFIKPEPKDDLLEFVAFTKKTAKLEPSGYSVAIVGPENFLFARVYDGPNPVTHFINCALAAAKQILKYIKNSSKKMKPTPEELERHRLATECMMCRQPFTEERKKVLHHDHITSKVIGSLDNVCNLKVKFKKVLPCVCHNAVNFDHAIISRAFRRENVKSVYAVPKNTVKYLGFIVDKKLKFMDSCQFLASSLAGLVDNLKKSGIDKFKNTKKYFGRDDKVLDELLLSKQIYPYDYMTGPEVYADLELPSKEKFYDGLNEKAISEADYEHAKKVWREMNCKTFRDFTRFYSISDALLLADVFENFRDSAFESQQLDPLYVWSAPGFSWDCAMFQCEFELEYIKDFEMLKMLEEGIRGGPTFVCERISTANNEQLGDACPFDPTKPRRHILYNDVNALYSKCMTMKLGYKDFKMLTAKEIEEIDIMSLDPDADTSYIFQVDLDYPEHLHDDHDDLPLAVEKKKVEPIDLSPTQARLVELYSQVIRKPLGGEKLIMTLHPKKEYTTYLKTLQFYIKHGLVITKVHKGFSFTQDYIFRDYIMSNIDKRRETKSELMSNLYKLLNNSLYGKTLQNSKNFVDVVFCLTRQQTVKELAKSNLKSFMILDKDVTVCQLSRTKVVCNSFIYLGFIILELAKLILYEAYYDGIKKVFGPRVRVQYGDTDSLIVGIEDPENTLNADLAKLSSWYDFSNLAVDHPLYNNQNKGVPGLWKLVVNNISEVVAISSKMYSVLTAEDVKEAKEHNRRIAAGEHPPNESRGKKKELMKKGKGVGRGVLEKLQHEHYIKSITEHNKIFHVKMKGIRMDKTDLNRVEMRKIGFHALDTKRFILRGGIHTLAFGNYRIKQIIQEESRLENDINSKFLTLEQLQFNVPIDQSKRNVPMETEM